MTQLLRPGNAGEPLPAGEVVFRLLKHSTFDGGVSPMDFTMSSEDEKAPLKSLSVCVEVLTTPNQALNAFTEDKRPAYKHHASLNVGSIRSLRPTPDSIDVPSLDAVWDPLVNEQTGLAITALGMEGHSGITGLIRVPDLANAKNYCKSLREELVKMANASVRTMPEA